MARLRPLAARWVLRRLLRMGERRRPASGAVPSGRGRGRRFQRLVSARRSRASGSNSTGPELATAPGPIAAALTNGLLSSAAARRSPSDPIAVRHGRRRRRLSVQQLASRRRHARISRRRASRVAVSLTDPASPSGGPTQFGESYRADVSSFVGLINGYATPGTWYGFAPFLGAGVGLADNRVSGFADSSGGRFANGSRTSFAWALMAGVDYDVSPSLKLEFGYRYLNYGSIAAGGSDCRCGRERRRPSPVAASSSPVRSRRATDSPRTISGWASSI